MGSAAERRQHRRLRCHRGPVLQNPACRPTTPRDAPIRPRTSLLAQAFRRRPRMLCRCRSFAAPAAARTGPGCQPDEPVPGRGLGLAAAGSLRCAGGGDGGPGLGPAAKRGGPGAQRCTAADVRARRTLPVRHGLRLDGHAGGGRQPRRPRPPHHCAGCVPVRHHRDRAAGHAPAPRCALAPAPALAAGLGAGLLRRHLGARALARAAARAGAEEPHRADHGLARRGRGVATSLAGGPLAGPIGETGMASPFPGVSAMQAQIRENRHQTDAEYGRNSAVQPAVRL